MARNARALCLTLALLVVATAPARGGHDQPLFRPLTADPRENQFRMKFVDYTEDWRYGTDVTDPASVGGHEVRSNVSWDVGMGGILRFDPRRSLGFWNPWKLCEITVPAGVYATFDRVGAELINADYQFGVALETLWSGDTAVGGIRDFYRPCWTSILSVYHRSTHLGDEYLALGDFGANQQGHPAAGELFAHPPVKRVNLSFESLRSITSVEWSPRRLRPATVRIYAGGEWKLAIGDRLQPRNFNSPIGQLGAEFRSAANASKPRPTFLARFFNRMMHDDGSLTGEWMAALDLKLARPFNFASCDNPSGESEVWTPTLWSECPCGREFHSYAGSWHATVGHVFYLQSHRYPDSHGAHRIGPEFIVGLEWYRGYSPNGQFLDQRLRYRPLGYVVPGVVAHF